MKCNICDGNITIIDDLQQNKKYDLCDNCQIIQLEEKYIIHEQKEKAQYENHNNNFQSNGYVKMFEDFLDYFWMNLSKDCVNALEFGSGPGPVLAKILTDKGLSVDCYDKFYQSEKVYVSKKYDIITSTEVFEHLHNPIETLKLFKNHLKKDGIIAIMTLFHNNNTDEFLKWWYRRDPTHITFYTPYSFEVLANMCGLRILKHDNKRIIVLTSLE